MMRNYLFLLLIMLLSIIACDSNPTQIIRHEPVIHSITPQRTVVYVNDAVEIKAEVSDADEKDELRFQWSATGGSFVSEKNNPTQWKAPNQTGEFAISLKLSDGYYEVSKSVNIRVTNR